MSNYKSIDQQVRELFPESKERIMGWGKNLLDIRLAENDHYIVFVASINETRYGSVDSGTYIDHHLDLGILNKKRRNETDYYIMGCHDMTVSHPYSTKWYYKEKDDLRLSEINFIDEARFTVCLQKNDSEIYMIYEFDINMPYDDKVIYRNPRFLNKRIYDHK